MANSTAQMGVIWFGHNWHGQSWRLRAAMRSRAPQSGGATKAGSLEIAGLRTEFVAALFRIAAMNGLAAPHKADHNIGTEVD